MGRLLRRNIWIEAGISLFLMLFFIYFYCPSISGSSKPCPRYQPCLFPSVVTRPHHHERAAHGFCLGPCTLRAGKRNA
ncbi:MAG: hypothetical protein ACLR0N_11590 [Bilophila wadsworthia]